MIRVFGFASVAIGLVCIALATKVARSFRTRSRAPDEAPGLTADQRVFRIGFVFGAVVLIVVGGMWIAGIGTK